MHHPPIQVKSGVPFPLQTTASTSLLIPDICLIRWFSPSNLHIDMLRIFKLLLTRSYHSRLPTNGLTIRLHTTRLSWWKMVELYERLQRYTLGMVYLHCLLRRPNSQEKRWKWPNSLWDNWITSKRIQLFLRGLIPA